MSRLKDRVAIVTGAGRGLGRAHALALAAAGARVVVNDMGTASDGSGRDTSVAQAVVDEIEALGGEALASGHDVADWQQAEELVAMAVDGFGSLDVLVNNAGILRDRSLANTSEAEWDGVVRVVLKGHAAPSRHAIAYWRAAAKSGQEVQASIVHTSSLSGLIGNFGQANYGAAKLALVALSRIISLECAAYGVRSNVVAPGAATRLGTDPDGEGLDPQAPFAPHRVSPLVVWLAERDCPSDSQIFYMAGERIAVVAMPEVRHVLTQPGGWTVEAIDRALPDWLLTPPRLEDYIGQADPEPAGAAV